MCQRQVLRQRGLRYGEIFELQLTCSLTNVPSTAVIETNIQDQARILSCELLSGQKFFCNFE